MSRLDIKTPSKAQMVVEHLYRSMEHRIEASPPGLCPIDMALNFLNLCHAQTCGKCVPCRVGLGQLSDLLHEVLDLLDARSVLEASLHVSEDRRKLLARGDGAPVRKGPGHGRDDLLAVIALHASVPLHYVHGVSRLSL